MDSGGMPIFLNEKYAAHYDDTFIILEFTSDQDLYPEEEYLGMKAYECYLLDDITKDYDTRAILYVYDDITNGHKYFIKYKISEDEYVTINVSEFLPV